MLERLVQTADILVENFTPRVMEQFRLRLGPSPCAQPRAHHGPDACLRSRRPVAGSNGLRPDHGMSDRHVVADGIRRRPSRTRERRLDPLAGMHAAFATMLALIGGIGAAAEAGGISHGRVGPQVAAEEELEYSSNGTLLGRDGNRGPYAAPQGVYPCAGDDEWIAVAVASDEQWRSLRTLLGSPPGCAMTSRLSPVAGCTRRYRPRTFLVDPTPPSRRDGSDVARRGRTIRRGDSPARRRSKPPTPPSPPVRGRTPPGYGRP